MKFEPWNQDSWLKIVVGHYGSGKTEFALNMVVQARNSGRQALIADMDIVNPFFRSAEQEERLLQAGVELIAPPYARTGVDLPVLGAEVLSIFERPGRFSVLDVGGDDAGAAALGRFSGQITACGGDVYYVVNPFRPFSSTVEQVADMMARIERRGRVKVTGLVNNANLGQYTTADEIIRGRELLSQVSQETGVPLVCECFMDEAPQGLDEAAPQFVMQRMLMPEWLL